MPGITDLAPLVFTPDGGSSTTVAVRSVGDNRGLLNTPQRHSGLRFDSSILHAGGSPSISVEMFAKDALDNFGVGLTYLTTVVAHYATYSDGEIQSGANHISHTLDAAYAVIDNISCSQDGLAMATVRIVPVSSDGDVPYTESTSASLPSLSAEPVFHTLGSVAVGGSAVDGLQSFNVNFNHDMQPIRSDGERYATSVRYGGASMVISGTTIGATDIQAQAGFIGTTVTNLDFYLRENDTANGTLKSTGIELAVANGYLQIDNFNATQDSATAVSFTAIPESESNGTSPIVYTASATVA